MITAARRERDRLCDLFLDVGPSAPTLCGDWTTRDLAAHLVMRERRPDGAVGVLVKPLSGYAAKVQQGEADRDFGELVERVRTGPPVWSPFRVAPIDRLANTAEFFVHHEDVRRAGVDWDVRQLDADLQGDLHRALARSAKLLTRRSPTGLTLKPDGFPEIVAKRGDPMVTVSGPIGEVVLFAFGRQPQSRATLTGPDEAVEAVRGAPFGI